LVQPDRPSAPEPTQHVVSPSTCSRSRPGRISKAEAQLRHLRIIEAARDLFVDHGLAGVSFDAIARSANVAKRTIYLLYGSKEGLFIQVLQNNVDAIAEQVRSTRMASRTLKGALISIALNYFAAIDNPATLALYRMAIGECARIPDKARHAINIYGQESAQGIISGLLRGIEEKGMVTFHAREDFVQLFMELILAPNFYHLLVGEPGPLFNRTDTEKRVQLLLKAAVDDLYSIPTPDA
jgi:AcrR family transcriptional regulator